MSTTADKRTSTRDSENRNPEASKDASEITAVRTSIEAHENRGVVVGHGGYGFVAGGDIRLGALKQINFFRGASSFFRVSPVAPPIGWEAVPLVGRLLEQLEHRRLLVLGGDRPLFLRDLAVRLASTLHAVSNPPEDRPERRRVPPLILEWRGGSFEPDLLREELQGRDRPAVLLFPGIRRANLERLLACMGDLLGRRYCAIAISPGLRPPSGSPDGEDLAPFLARPDCDHVFPEALLAGILRRELEQRQIDLPVALETVSSRLETPGQIDALVNRLERLSGSVAAERLETWLDQGANPTAEVVRLYREAGERQQRLMVCLSLVDGMAIDQGLVLLDLLVIGPEGETEGAPIDAHDLELPGPASLLQEPIDTEGILSIRRDVDRDRLLDLAWRDQRRWLVRALDRCARLLYRYRRALGRGDGAWGEVLLFGSPDREERAEDLHTALLAAVGVRAPELVEPFLFAMAQARGHLGSGFSGSELRVTLEKVFAGLPTDTWLDLAGRLLERGRIRHWLAQVGDAGIEGEIEQLRSTVAVALGLAAVEVSGDSLDAEVLELLGERILLDDNLADYRVLLVLPRALDRFPDEVLALALRLAAHHRWLVRYGVAQAIAQNLERLGEPYATWFAETEETRNRLRLSTASLICLLRLRRAGGAKQFQEILETLDRLVQRNPGVRRDVARAAAWLADDWFEGVDRALEHVARSLGWAEREPFVRGLVEVYEVQREGLPGPFSGRSEETRIERLARSWLIDGEDHVLRNVAVEFYLALVDSPVGLWEAREGLTRWIRVGRGSGVVTPSPARHWPLLVSSLVDFVAVRILKADPSLCRALRATISHVLHMPKQLTQPSGGASTDEDQAVHWLASLKRVDRLIYRWEQNPPTQPLGSLLRQFLPVWKLRIPLLVVLAVFLYCGLYCGLILLGLLR